MDYVKVSIIIPIYNVEEFIEECLVSAINQSLKEIEIICVNDGTLDNSMDIVNRYAEQDERIIIVEKENGGLSSTRNAGMAVANGEYVYFLDSDDYLVKDAMKILYSYASENQLDDIFFSAESFFESEEVKEKNSFYIDYYTRSREYEGVYEGEKLFALMEENADFRPSACLQLNRRAFLQENNIKFYEGILHEDNLFSMQCITLAKRTMCISDKLYMRRVREGSIVTSMKGFKSSYGYFISIREYMQFLKKIDVDERFKLALIKRLRDMYGNAINKMVRISDEETLELLKDNTVAEQIEYMVYAKGNANRRKIDSDCQNKLRRENEYLRREVLEVRKSVSYRIGHIFVYIPGKIKRIILKIKQKWF